MLSRKSAAIVLCAALAFTITAALPTFAGEKRAASPDELQRIQEELKGVKSKAREAKRQERSILTEIEAMDQSLAEKRSEVRKAESRLAEVGREMGSTESETEAKRAKMKAREQDLAGRLRAMYKSGRSGGPWVLLVSGGYGSVLKRYKYLSVVSRQDKRLMDGYSEDLEGLARYRERLYGQREKFDRLKGERDQEAKSAQAKEEEKKTLLASVRRQKGAYEAMARELEESGRRMQELLKKFEVESAKPKPGPPGAALPPLRAGLDWPVEGKVVGRFGRQKHPDYDTYIFKKGIEVEAGLGDEVHAVEAAEVVFANWFKGLGLVAILRHGGDFYTVYAHLSEVMVKTGERVSKGQAIATIGDTGAPSGPSLYFELRKGSEAVDPLLWLKKRGKGLNSKK